MQVYRSPKPLINRHMNKKLPLLFLGLVMSWVAWAQQKTISGKVVTSENAAPAPRETVTVERTPVATQTDLEGTDEIQSAKAQANAVNIVVLKNIRRTVRPLANQNESM